MHSFCSGKAVNITYYEPVYEVRINYQLDSIEYLFVYFSSTCFGLICPTSGAMDVTISFTYAAYGVLGVARCRS